MNHNAKNLIKNINYTVTANFLVLGISVLLNLFVPKFIGVEEYSYWQIYVFYSSYVGFLHFGWLDGIYLKIGGKEYDDLDHGNLGSQFWYLFIFEIFLSIALLFSIVLFSSSSTNAIILSLTAFVSIIRNCNTFILYIFQSTNRIKEYAQISRNDRYIYVVFISIYILFGGNDYFILITLDIIARLLVTLWGALKIRDILFFRPQKFTLVKGEIFSNISVGINLMLSNIAGMLIIGISRVFVEYKWSVETFGKLSLTLSISNMFMTFINAVGVVMFPLLRRTDKNRLSELYFELRNVFVPITYLLLLLFLPIKEILGLWLPAYRQSLVFMGILFPMVIYEGRMSLLVSTYLKTIRKEKTILYANVISLSFSIICSAVTALYIKNLFLTVGVIVFSLAIRCMVAENLLIREWRMSLGKLVHFETLLTIAFILSNFFLEDGVSFCLYLFLFVVYIILNYKSCLSSFKILVSKLQS